MCASPISRCHGPSDHRCGKIRVVEPKMIYSFRTAYANLNAKYNDRFETSSPLFMIDVDAVILAGLPPVKHQTMEFTNLIVELASIGTKHVLKFARAANVTKVIFTGSFSNVLHPDDSWNPIVVTENGTLTERVT